MEGYVGDSVTPSPVTVTRLPNWGWELSGDLFLIRAVDNDNAEDMWQDLTSKIIVQEKPEWIKETRSGGQYSYNYREIPDDEACKMLPW